MSGGPGSAGFIKPSGPVGGVGGGIKRLRGSKRRTQLSRPPWTSALSEPKTGLEGGLEGRAPAHPPPPPSSISPGVNSQGRLKEHCVLLRGSVACVCPPSVFFLTLIPFPLNLFPLNIHPNLLLFFSLPPAFFLFRFWFVSFQRFGTLS